MVRRVIGEGDVWCQFTSISLILADHFSENALMVRCTRSIAPLLDGWTVCRRLSGITESQEISDVPHDVIVKFSAHVADLEDWAAEQQINVPDQGLGDGQGRFVSDRHTDEVFSEVIYCR